jgi:hypothetical protein
MLDVNAKILAEHIFECKKIRRGKLHPLFLIESQKYKSSTTMEIKNRVRFDTILAHQLCELQYDQLEASNMIANTERKKIQNIKNKRALARLELEEKNGFTEPNKRVARWLEKSNS